MQQAAEVHAAGEHLVPDLNLTGQTLAGEGAGVHGGLALRHHAVNGDTLAGLHYDDGAHLHVVGIHLFQGAVLLDVGIVGADVHEVGDAAAALAHSVALEQLAHLIEHHDGAALAPVAQGHGAHGGHGHEEVLVKHLPAENALHGLEQNVIADDKIRDEVQHALQPAGEGREPDGRHQHRRHEDADEVGFLLLCHGVYASLLCLQI